MLKMILNVLNKISQNLITDLGTFFRVKLHPIKIVFFYSRRIFQPIIAMSDGIVAIFSIIAVHIVYVAFFLDVLK